MTVTVADVKFVAENYLLPVGLKMLIAIVIFVVGRWISRAVLSALDRLMERSKLDVSLRKFLGDVAYGLLFAVVVIAALDTIGIKTTAVVAVLGAAGLAVGLALQGSLANFAAGVMLIMLRPYKVSDSVIIGKYLGRVDAIKVFNTILITSDNREITIPNGQIIGAPIENLSVLGRRRIDLLVTVTQGELAKVRELLAHVTGGDPRITQSPAPAIDVAEVSDGSIKLRLQPWTSVESYGAVAADTMESIKKAMDAAGMKYSVAAVTA
ncbi:MAG TPA: mechanosensitive ion channel domain-containing protein [Kofleriaceae bacterium]|nr:mechanosensitive ion channel domain-containing protein [Kofleriaceae bacterium]